MLLARKGMLHAGALVILSSRDSVLFEHFKRLVSVVKRENQGIALFPCFSAFRKRCLSGNHTLISLVYSGKDICFVFKRSQSSLCLLPSVTMGCKVTFMIL